MSWLDKLATDAGVYNDPELREYNATHAKSQEQAEASTGSKNLEQQAKGTSSTAKTVNNTPILLPSLSLSDSIVYLSGYVFIILCICFTIYYFIKTIKNKNSQ